MTTEKNKICRKGLSALKVLHMISGGDTGGAKTHVFALLGKLKDMADVKIVCFMKGVFWDELQNIDVDSELIEQKSRFDMSVLKRLREICADGVDVIHCHGARANFIAASLKKHVDIPMITTIHSDYLLDFDGLYRKIVYTGLNVYALKKFRYFIAVSDNFRQMLISRSFRPNSVYTVYNGMDYSGTPDFVSKEEFAKRIGITYDPKIKYVGLIGRHDYVKGHDVFIKAMKDVCRRFEDVRFIIAGDGAGRETLAELAKAEGVSDKLIFAGFVKDIYSFINFIDINTLTSRSESFPYVLMEGARMSKPTVCSAVGGIPDLIKDSKTGLLFKSEDSAELARKIIFLLEHPDEAKKYGEALHTLALEHFSDTALAKKHVEIYKSVRRDYFSDKKYDIVMSGYYGFRNSGDDALFYAIVSGLKKHMPDIRVCVLSARAAQMRRQYRVDCEPRFNPFAVLRTLRRSSMLLSGGGSLIQDATSSKSLIYYLSVMKMAKNAGAKLYVYANGIGPLKDKNLKRAAKVLEKADYITLRDPASLDEIKRMGIKNKNVLVTADPALTLEGPTKSELAGFFAENGIEPSAEFFGISVRPWQNNDPMFVKKIAEIADFAAENYSLVPLFLPMRYPHDLKISEEIAALTKAKSYVIKNPCSVREMIGLASCCELVLGMRLHMLIYAAGAAVPIIGINYDKKVPDFLEYIGQSRCIDAENISAENAFSYIRQIMSDKQRISEVLSEQKKRLAAIADKNAEIAVELLNSDLAKESAQICVIRPKT